MYETLAIALKDLRLLLRDKPGFFFAFFFPIIYASFFGLIFAGASAGGGGASRMKVVVADEDASNASREFTERLKSCKELDISTADATAAREMVRTGQRTAMIRMPKDFGQRQDRMFWGETPVLGVGVDPGRAAEAGMLQGILIREYMRSFQTAMTDSKKMRSLVQDALKDIDAATDMPAAEKSMLMLFLPALESFMSSSLVQTADQSTASQPTSGVAGFRGFEPVRFETEDVIRRRTGPPNAYAISFPQGIIWGVMGCAAAFGISLVTERTSGTLTRLRMSAISRRQILGGKACACLATTLGVSITMLIFARVVFGVRPPSLIMLASAVVCVCLGFVGIMMLLSVLGKTEQAAGGIGWGILTIMAMLGGGMVPVFFMPQWMQTLGSVSPVKWSILAMEGAIWRNYSASEMALPCGIMLAVGGVCFTLGSRLFSWAERA